MLTRSVCNLIKWDVPSVIRFILLILIACRLLTIISDSSAYKWGEGYRNSVCFLLLRFSLEQNSEDTNGFAQNPISMRNINPVMSRERSVMDFSSINYQSFQD